MASTGGQARAELRLGQPAVHTASRGRRLLAQAGRADPLDPWRGRATTPAATTTPTSRAVRLMSRVCRALMTASAARARCRRCSGAPPSGASAVDPICRARGLTPLPGHAAMVLHVPFSVELPEQVALISVSQSVGQFTPTLVSAHTTPLSQVQTQHSAGLAGRCLVRQAEQTDGKHCRREVFPADRYGSNRHDAPSQARGRITHVRLWAVHIKGQRTGPCARSMGARGDTSAAGRRGARRASRAADPSARRSPRAPRGERRMAAADAVGDARRAPARTTRSASS